MTHVFVDARNITKQPAGVARYAMAIIPRMIAAEPHWSWTILRHVSNRTPLFNAEEVFVDEPIDGLQNFVGGARVYQRALAGRTPDVVHCLFHLLPRHLPDEPHTVITAHDFIWIDHPEISQRSKLAAFTTSQFARRAIPYALRAADHVIAVSGATAERATQWIEAEKITVIPHGVEPRYFCALPPDDAIVEFLRKQGGRYVVAVGNDKHYKNLHTLVRAFAALPDPRLRLVLVGSCEGLMPLAESLGVANRVMLMGFLSDEDLRRVVGNADVFVFPSLVEGFGMPPLEAMALGVPTLVSDLEPMRGIAGDAAMRFEPTDVAGLIALITVVLDDKVLADRLAALGRARAEQFDWDQAAKRTLAVYRS